MAQDSIEIVLSYSPDDKELRDELEKHLKPLKRQGVISIWHEGLISAGTEREKQIEQHLKTAHIILLLISANFFNSNHCCDVELELAMHRHEAGEIRVIPIILRPVDWQNTQLGKLQPLPRNASPVTSWADRHEAFSEIAKEIRAVIEDLSNERRRRRAAEAQAILYKFRLNTSANNGVKVKGQPRLGCYWFHILSEITEFGLSAHEN